MCTEKCRLKYNEPKRIVENGEVVGFQYKAKIILPDDGECTLRANNYIFSSANCSGNKLYMYLDCSEKQNFGTLQSEFWGNCDQMRLASIKVPAEMRSQGLGTCVLESWLRLLPAYEELHNIHISTIEGIVLPDGGVTLEHVKKLYAHFDGFAYTDGKKLVLDTEALENTNILKYTIVAASH